MLRLMLKKIIRSVNALQPKQQRKQNFSNIAHTRPTATHLKHSQPQRRDTWLGTHRSVLRRRRVA